ncbi:MAG: thioredoxin family protein [Firmicutes bacterium]|nr:thioredoxin family protein [Bacillota bacterium]
MNRSTRLALIVAVIAVVAVGWAVGTRRDSKAVLAEATPQDLSRAAKSGLPYVVKVGSNTCAPCRAMNPVIDALAEAYRGTVGFYNVDVYQYPNISTGHNVRVIPTLLFFSQGGKLVHRVEGYMSQAQVTSAMKSLGMIE